MATVEVNIRKKAMSALISGVESPRVTPVSVQAEPVSGEELSIYPEPSEFQSSQLRIPVDF